MSFSEVEGGIIGRELLLGDGGRIVADPLICNMISDECSTSFSRELRFAKLSRGNSGIRSSLLVNPESLLHTCMSKKTIKMV